MNIEVKTAAEGCADLCPEFRVKTVNLYKSNTYERSYRCEHLEECRAIKEILKIIKEI